MGPLRSAEDHDRFFIHSHLTEGLGTPLADYQIGLNKEVFKYLRSLDMEDVTIVEDPGPLKCQLTTNDPGGGRDYKFNFYLTHPRLGEWVSSNLYIELYNKEYGTDHRYWGLAPYAETRFPEGRLFDYMLSESSRVELSRSRMSSS